MKTELEHSCSNISELFDAMNGQNASNLQVELVAAFRARFPELNDDLDFCFEVLAGKHKLGFTLQPLTDQDRLGLYDIYENATSIRDIYDLLYMYTDTDRSEFTIYKIVRELPATYYDFFTKLFNREYRLGYSNRKNMVTNLHCMLAKVYPKDLVKAKDYYVQEKLNGNRCIAYYDFDARKWKYTSRSQKEKFYPFDMTKLDKNLIYDGEVMSRGLMGNRDFSKTSGLANSLYGDKSSLVYIIYDILDATKIYEERWQILKSFVTELPEAMTEKFVFEKTNISDNVAILPPLAKIYININPEYNHQLDKMLNYITSQGGEGLIIRDPSAPYYHSSGSGDRKPYLLKYKKLKTADLRIIGWNEGKGKYEGMIGSFICEDDEHTIRVSVAGIDDEVRATNPDLFIGKIIEVAYFETSSAKNKSIDSLQFPRFKAWRPDKTETSLY